MFTDLIAFLNFHEDIAWEDCGKVRHPIEFYTLFSSLKIVCFGVYCFEKNRSRGITRKPKWNMLKTDFV